MFGLYAHGRQYLLRRSTLLSPESSAAEQNRRPFDGRGSFQEAHKLLPGMDGEKTPMSGYGVAFQKILNDCIFGTNEMNSVAGVEAAQQISLRVAHQSEQVQVFGAVFSRQIL